MSAWERTASPCCGLGAVLSPGVSGRPVLGLPRRPSSGCGRALLPRVCRGFVLRMGVGLGQRFFPAFIEQFVVVGFNVCVRLIFFFFKVSPTLQLGGEPPLVLTCYPLPFCPVGPASLVSFLSCRWWRGPLSEGRRVSVAPGESSLDRRQGSLPPVPGSRRRAGGEHKRALGPRLSGAVARVPSRWTRWRRRHPHTVPTSGLCWALASWCQMSTMLN